MAILCHFFKFFFFKYLDLFKSLNLFKSLQGLAPDYFCSKFERRETAYSLRNSENRLNVPLPRTNYYENRFSYSGATLWNSLPRDIRQAVPWVI